VDIERTLETQRLKLLRIVAGLVVAVGFLALGPVSRVFSERGLGFVGSVLARAEAAARNLVITQVCLIAGRRGLALDCSLMVALSGADLVPEDTDVSWAACQRRLKVLRAVLSNLPRQALRLLRRIAKHARRKVRSHSQRFDPCHSISLRGGRRVAIRIERPPDKRCFSSLSILPLPECRVGGAGG